MDSIWFFLILFIASLAFLLWHRCKKKADVEAQFVMTGIVLLIFYVVCFLSGVCTILNFLWRWII